MRLRGTTVGHKVAPILQHVVHFLEKTDHSSMDATCQDSFDLKAADHSREIAPRLPRPTPSSLPGEMGVDVTIPSK